MSDSQITIFYSWQSDLPGNETRNIIQDGIKDAVRLLRDTVDIEADRDTKGEYGSPDIANTIFSKIDDCDIFVADVSAVCKYEVTDKDGNVKTKYMPNPNVMLELGYATHVVGWDNVICVLNADYGAPEDMPFDIASRRLTPFSLKDGSSKGDAKRFIKSVIQETVEHILENGKRVKSGFSDLRIGTYNDGMICNKVTPYSIASSTKYLANKKLAIDECFKLYEEIKAIKLSACTLEPEDTLEDSEDTSPEIITTKDGSVLTPIKSPLNVNLFKAQRVSIKEDDRVRVCDFAKQYLSIDIEKDDDIFEMGNLKQKFSIGVSSSYELFGEPEEKEKYNKLMSLEYRLHQIKMHDWYITTFDGYLLIPLVIVNESTIPDEDIDIFVSVDETKAQVVLPSKTLINPEMRGLEGLLYDDGIIKNLLMMPESSDVSYDTDISYNLADSLAQNQAAVRAQFGGNGIPKKPKGMHAVVPATDELPEGVVFILKNINNSVNIDNQNRIHPFYMVYIGIDGEVICDYLNPKKMLDDIRLLCRGKKEPIKELCQRFNEETDDGRDMTEMSELLSEAINSIIDCKEESDIDSLFSAGGTSALMSAVSGLDDFELICFLVVK